MEKVDQPQADKQIEIGGGDIDAATDLGSATDLLVEAYDRWRFGRSGDTGGRVHVVLLAGFSDRARCQIAKAVAWSGQRSLSGAGEMVQLVQIGASHVPVRFPVTFQSQSKVAGRPQVAQRWRLPDEQTIAR